MEGSLITVVLTIATATALIGSMLVASWLAPRLLGPGWSKVRPDTSPYECGSRPFDRLRPVRRHRQSHSRAPRHQT